MARREDRVYTSNRIFNRFREIEKMHPHKMLTYLFLFGSFLTLVFLLVSFTVEFVSQQPAMQGIVLPKFFIIGTLVIMASGYLNRNVIQSYNKDDIEGIRKKLFGVFIVGSVFLIFQFVGWLEYIFQGLTFSENVIGTYLFLITGYHMLHVLIGLVTIAYFLYRTKDIFIDPVSNLIYFTSPYERIKLEIFISFWNFINISWIFLFVWLVFIL